MAEDIYTYVGRLKDEYRREFRDTRSEITRLEAKLEDLRRKLNFADELLAKSAAAEMPIGPVNGKGKYSDFGVTEALRAFFTEHRFTSHSISALTHRLTLEGLRARTGTTTDLRATISITCRRLQDDGFLTSELERGVRIFRLADRGPKKETGGTSKTSPARQS